MIALATAAENGDVKEIDRLIDSGVDVNAVGKDGMTVLHWAMRAKNKAGFTRLLQRGADPNERLVEGASVMCAAAEDAEATEWLKILLKNGGRVNHVRPKDDGDVWGGTTPIWFAILSRQPKNVELLVRASADLNHQDQDGETPMIYAARFGWFDTVYRLLEAGADYRIKDRHGRDLAYEIADSDIDPMSTEGQWRAKVQTYLERKGVDFAPIRKQVEAKRKELQRRKAEEDRAAEEREEQRKDGSNPGRS